MRGKRWVIGRNRRCFLLGFSHWVGRGFVHIYLGPWLLTIQGKKS